MVLLEETDWVQAGMEPRLRLVYTPRIDARSLRVIGAEVNVVRRGRACKLAGRYAEENLSSSNFALFWCWKLERIRECLGIIKGNQAMSSDKAHRGDDRCFSISFHFSTRYMSSDAWALQLLDMIADVDVPGRSIEVLINDDGTTFVNTCHVAATLEMLRAVGVKLVLNDFPLAGSSLIRLIDHRFDKIKLCSSLVPRASESVTVWSRKKEVIRGLTGIATRMGLEVVLDGIDHEANFNHLRDLRIGEWQGRYWSGAMDLEDMLAHVDV